jgi:hypothetical protein
MVSAGAVKVPTAGAAWRAGGARVRAGDAVTPWHASGPAGSGARAGVADTIVAVGQEVPSLMRS